MKTAKFALCVLLAAPLVGPNVVDADGPVGTAFTYQGQLKAGGGPASGTFDFRFLLYEDEETAIAQAQALAVPVVNGLFTVQVDFGPGFFEGDARWLEVLVRPAGGAKWSALTPRQELTAVPYAQYALGAAWGGLLGIPAGFADGVDDDMLAELSCASGQIAQWNGSDWVCAEDESGGGGFWQANGDKIFNTNKGSVGIGTTNPSAKLDIRGIETTGLVVDGPFTGDGTSVSIYGITEGRTLLSHNDGTGHAGYFIGRVYISKTLFVGRQDPIASTEYFGLNANVNSGFGGMYVSTSGKEAWPFYGYAPGGNSGMLHYYDGTAGKWHLRNAGGDRLTVQLDGNVGIGTIAPEAKLHVYSTSDAEPDGGGVAVFGPITGGNVVIDGNEIMARNDGVTSTLFLNNDGGDVSISQTGTGKLIVPVIQITGADLAEKFPVTEKVEPGIVVEIDSNHVGKLRMARGAYNRRVAGVVSGANGLSVGAVLGNLPGSENAPPIALSGRVWVYCDATTNPIEAGDLLTTSDTPGHAMKVDDHARAQGAIMGKAMSSLLAGKGLVLVLVSLQ